MTIDAAYRRFPSFPEWGSPLLDDDLWRSAVAAFEGERSQASLETRNAVLEFALRAAAIDTGAIEGMYAVDRGFTITVAAQSAAWEAQMAEKGAEVRRHFDAHLAGLRYVIDAVANEVPITEAWIRQLHEVICASQDTYDVRTPQGVQKQALQKGIYKRHPNHVELKDGRHHAYAPVDMTPAEMHRLVAEITSESFATAHPIVQAAYAHYGLVAVHPFADGNGRVSRALASLPLIRSASVPLVIFADRKPEYFQTLAQADAGDQAPFVRFLFEVVVDTIRDLTLRFREARTAPLGKTLEALEKLYVGHGGLTHEELDAVAHRVGGWIQEEFERQLSEVRTAAHVDALVRVKAAAIAPRTPGFRRLVDNSHATIRVILRSTPPAAAEVQASFHVVVASGDAAAFAIAVEKLDSEESFEIRLKDVDPARSSAFDERLRTWVSSEIRRLGEALAGQAAAALGRAGYR